MKRLFKYLLLICIIIVLCFILNIYKKNDIVVLSIKTYNNDILYKEGNGFVYKIDDYAYILTNYHVISESDSIYVYYNDYKIKANILNYDEYDDIAIITIDKKYINKKMKISNFNFNDKVRIVTNNLSVDGYVLSDINAVKINYLNKSKMLDLIKINSNIKEGYSGSPVINRDNMVIGIMTMVDTDNGDSYAIPIDVNKINDLESGNLYRANLGIKATTSLDIKGVLLSEVYDNKCASKGNLISGDIIVSINDIKINDVLEFRYYLYKYKIGDIVKIKYYRDGNYYDTFLTLEQGVYIFFVCVF